MLIVWGSFKSINKKLKKYTNKIHHIADDINLLYTSGSHKDINKKINFDLSNLVKWFKTNKMALNLNITDIAIFQSS